MHIECKLKREGGSFVELDKISYHFALQPDGAYVALVDRADHQDRLLGIPEGYRVYRGEHKPASAATAAELGLGLQQGAEDGGDDEQRTGEQALLGSSQHDAAYQIHGKDYTLSDLATLAATANGLSAEDWNGLSDDGRADLIDAELDKLSAGAQPPQDPQPPVDEAAVRAELAAQYKAKTGNAAHHTWDADKIRAKLAE